MLQDEAVKAHEEAFEKSAGKGTKIDLVLSIIRIGFFHSDHELVMTNIDRAQKCVASLPLPLRKLTCRTANRLVDEGGDWDRRNRLKVYEGVHLLSIRSFKKGAELLLDALPTFTATELIEYDDFVVLCVLAGVLALERKDLKKKVRWNARSLVVVSRWRDEANTRRTFCAQVIDAPEVIAVVPNVPTIKDFAESLYKSDYATFFRCLGSSITCIPSAAC